MYLKRKTRPPRRAAPAIGRAGASVFALLAQKTKFMDPMLAGHWPTLAGPRLASLSRPGRITGSRQNGGKTLELHVPSGAAATEVQMQSDELMKRVNAYLGPGTIARILVLQAGGRQGGGANPGTKANTPHELKTDDSPLGSALASFRAAINRRNDDK